MRAVKYLVVAKDGFVAETPAWAGAVPATEAMNKDGARGSHLRNIALFFAAPFVGLAYILSFPLVGFGILVWMACKKLLANEATRPVVLGIAAPLASIAFVTVAPVAGLGALAWIGARALLKR